MTEDMRPVAFLVGASSGLGRALAMELAQDYRLILLASAQARLEETDDLVRAACGVSATLVPMTLEKHDDIDQMVAGIWQRFGRLDLLVGLAATITDAAPLAHTPSDSISKMHHVNYLAHTKILASCDPILRNTTNARVMMITGGLSTPDAERNAFTAAFDASKAALHSLAESYALELEQSTVRAATVIPSPFVSRLRRKIFPGLADHALCSATDKAKTLAEIIRQDAFMNGAQLEI